MVKLMIFPQTRTRVTNIIYRKSKWKYLGLKDDLGVLISRVDGKIWI